VSATATGVATATENGMALPVLTKKDLSAAQETPAGARAAATSDLAGVQSADAGGRHHAGEEVFVRAAVATGVSRTTWITYGDALRIHGRAPGAGPTGS